MQFNNKQFEDGIQTSLKSLDGLKKGLDDTGKGGSLGAIQSGVETISSKFSALGIMGVTALQNIASSAVEAGAKLVKSLSTDNIKAGFDEYELKMGSIQTIMAGTGEGLAIGLASMAGAVGDAAAGVGQSAVDSLGKAISGISDEVGSMDADPTIRPVLDFSDIQAGLAKMDQMFADSKSISLDLSSAIAASNSSAKRGADSESSAGQEAQTVQIVNKFDLTGLTVRSEADIDAIAAKLYQKQQQAMRGRGVRGLALV
jgi:hypothetical protein